jgi:cell division protein FtsX
MEKKDIKTRLLTMFWAALTTAVSTIVAAVLVGACSIIWNGVNTVNSRIECSENKIKATIDVISKSTDDLADQIKKISENQEKESQIIEKLLIRLEKEPGKEKEVIKEIKEIRDNPIDIKTRGIPVGIQEQIQQKIFETKAK